MKNILKGAFALALLVMLMVGAVVPQELSANTAPFQIGEPSSRSQASTELQVHFQKNHVGKFVGGEELSYVSYPFPGTYSINYRSSSGESTKLQLMPSARYAADHRGQGQNLPPKKPIDHQESVFEQNSSNLKVES